MKPVSQMCYTGTCYWRCNIRLGAWIRMLDACREQFCCLERKVQGQLS